MSATPRALVFDSGVGGLSIVDAIADAGLDLDLDYLADAAWLPYGERSPDALRQRIPRLLAAAADALGSSVVVIACNTASTLALDAARAALRVPVVGVVPPVKPAAAESRTKVIGVLATPATIASPYLDDLIARFAAGCLVRRCAAPELVRLAEASLAGAPPAPEAISASLAPLFAGPEGARLDVVALACTHFPLLRAALAAAGPPGVRWLDSGAAVARRLAAVANAAPGRVRLDRPLSTAPSAALAAAARARGFAAAATGFPGPM